MTLYALRPDPVTGSLDDAEVVDEFMYGWQFLEQVITLWHLVDDDRADRIKAIKDRAARSAPEESRFYTEDLRELCACLPELKMPSLQPESLTAIGEFRPIAWRRWPGRYLP